MSTDATDVNAKGLDNATVTATEDAFKLPTYELSSYEPVDLDLNQHKLSDEDLEEALQEQISNMSLDLVESERVEVNAQDILKLNMEISEDGEIVKNLSSDDRLYMMGDNFMPIGFERGLFGMKVGQLKEFDFDGTIGQDSNVFSSVPPAQNNHNFHAKVEVLAIMQHSRPEINDEWVAKNMPFYKSAAEFREKTREEIEEQMREIYETQAQQSAVEKLSERFTGTIDDSLYETTRDELQKGYEARAKAQGLDFQDYLGMQGIDEKEYNMMLMLEVRDTLVQGYSLDAWARHYNIEPSEEDIEKLANMMSGEHADKFLEEQKKHDPKLLSLRIAARRFAANKDLVKRSLECK